MRLPRPSQMTIASPRSCRRAFLKHCALGAVATSIMREPVWADSPPVANQSWMTFRNGLLNQGVAASHSPETPTLLWESPLTDGTSSTPVIDAGRVYIGDLSGAVRCLDLSTGQSYWTYKSLDPVPDNSFAPGFNAAAALDAQHVYLGDDAGGFHAVRRSDGQLAWKAETEGEIVGGAQLLDSRVIFGSHDGYLYCHQASDGAQIWKCKTHGPVNATPCLSGKYTFTTGCDQPILRIIDTDTGEQFAEAPLDGLLIAAAAAYEDVLYFGTDAGEVQALNWKTRERVWKFSVPNRDQQIQSSPAVTDDVVVIGSRDKHVYCLDRRTGAQRWAFATRARVDSSPVIAGDRVFFGSSDRNLYGLALADGKEVWRQPVQQPVTGSIAIADGKLIVGTDSTSGRVLCFGGKS